MRSLLTVLETKWTHRNVLLFLLKLIHSCPDTFLPFVSTFFGPVLAVVASGRLAGAAATLDYFTSDLLSWGRATEPERRRHRRRPHRRQPSTVTVTVVNFLAKQNVLTRTDAVRRRRCTTWELELWRPCFLQDGLELGTVASLLAAGGPQAAAGVQVLAALLVNGLGSTGELAREVQLTQCLAMVR